MKRIASLLCVLSLMLGCTVTLAMAADPTEVELVVHPSVVLCPPPAANMPVTIHTAIPFDAVYDDGNDETSAAEYLLTIDVYEIPDIITAKYDTKGNLVIQLLSSDVTQFFGDPDPGTCWDMYGEGPMDGFYDLNVTVTSESKNSVFHGITEIYLQFYGGSGPWGYD